ncbi:MAG: TonB-dependent receptor [Myxococcota bacterium]
MNRFLPRFAGLALLAALTLASTAAFAQGRTGRITGRVTDEESGKAVAGVTVTVTGPALQGELTEFTDGDGRYTITEVPPGEYLVRFYFGDLQFDRGGVRISANDTLAVNFQIPSKKATTQTIVVTERAPSVDVGSATDKTKFGEDLVKKTPIRGRTFESVISAAPGAATDDVGYTFNGATGPENNYIIEGLSTTNPALGLVGSSIPLEFVYETQLITSGYSAEYGHATGGVVNVVTKSGTNDFKGEAWFNVVPGQADPQRTGRLGEALARDRYVNNRGVDFGLTLGGPIIKDRVWFFLGIAPEWDQVRTHRVVRRRTADSLPAATMSGSYAGDVETDPTAVCPDYIKARDPRLCAAGSFKTTDIPGAGRDFYNHNWGMSYIGKIDVRIDDDNRFSFEYIGTPQLFDGFGASNSKTTAVGLDVPSTRFKENNWVHDVIGRFTSKLLDRHLQIDAVVGYHIEDLSQHPASNLGEVTDTNTVPLSKYESIAACTPSTIHGVSFNPCPIANYSYGGFGFANDTIASRFNAQLSATVLFNAGGTHEVKVGTDFEINGYEDHRYYTSGATYDILTDGSAEITRQFAAVIDGKPVILTQGFDPYTETWREAFYLRDQWSPKWIPGLMLEPGIRWELEQIKNGQGDTAVSINDNFAPRLSAVYDFTQKGLSRIFVSYGQFFEATPLDINDRQFAGEGLITDYAIDGCKNDAQGRLDPATCHVPPVVRDNVSGGTYGIFSPSLKGQYSNEITAGLNVDVGWDVVLGAKFIHRDLGRVVEDLSVDGAVTYVISNPGAPTDPGVVKNLQDQINDLNNKLAADPNNADLAQQKADKITLLKTYKGIEAFPKPTRNYNALQLTAEKRFTKNFTLLASYTYGRTFGNYPGLYQSSNGQLDPNISTAFDLPDLLQNHDGPLPNDRPHLLKIRGAYFIPTSDVRKEDGVTIGAAFSMTSGIPIEVLGRNPIYGPLETYILPRGSGGRTPMIYSLDLSALYRFDKVEFSLNVFNALNFRGVTSVDEEYTRDRVNAIQGGTIDDLKNLRTTDGRIVNRNPTYGQPQTYQAPLFVRLGARVYF